jgi:hypothetical protein
MADVTLGSRILTQQYSIDPMEQHAIVHQHYHDDHHQHHAPATFVGPRQWQRQ